MTPQNNIYLWDFERGSLVTGNNIFEEINSNFCNRSMYRLIYSIHVTQFLELLRLRLFRIELSSSAREQPGAICNMLSRNVGFSRRFYYASKRQTGVGKDQDDFKNLDPHNSSRCSNGIQVISIHSVMCISNVIEYLKIDDNLASLCISHDHFNGISLIPRVSNNGRKTDIICSNVLPSLQLEATSFCKPHSSRLLRVMDVLFFRCLLTLPNFYITKH